MNQKLQKRRLAHRPLSPASSHILLALAGEDLHGYGIMQSFPPECRPVQNRTGYAVRQSEKNGERRAGGGNCWAFNDDGSAKKVLPLEVTRPHVLARN
jgi:hypothetical protein